MADVDTLQTVLEFAVDSCRQWSWLARVSHLWNTCCWRSLTHSQYGFMASFRVDDRVLLLHEECMRPLTNVIHRRRRVTLTFVPSRALSFSQLSKLCITVDTAIGSLEALTQCAPSLEFLEVTTPTTSRCSLSFLREASSLQTLVLRNIVATDRFPLIGCEALLNIYWMCSRGCFSFEWITGPVQLRCLSVKAAQYTHTESLLIVTSLETICVEGDGFDNSVDDTLCNLYRMSRFLTFVKSPLYTLIEDDSTCSSRIQVPTIYTDAS